MRALFFTTALLVCVPTNAAFVLSENVGSPSAVTAINLYSGWQNSPTPTFTGTGNVFNSAPTSTGYTGASGLGYVSIKGSPTVHANFEISSINTSAYTGTFTLTFGAYKSSTVTNMTDLILDYSSNGTTYTPIPIPAQPTGTGTNVWRLLTFSNITLPTVSNLHLRWTNNNSSPLLSYGLDDISLQGTVAAVPEASSYLAFLAVGLVGLAVRFLNPRS